MNAPDMTLAVEAPTDDALWERAAAGEPDAFGTLYERHARAIYNYLFRRCADWALAEDLTSVVFLEAYRRRSEVEIRQGKVVPWLYGVATNVLRSQRRSMRRHAAALERLPRSKPGEAVPDDAAARLDAERQMRATLVLLGRLPRRQQEALALCVWSGLSYEEAAAALGVPVGTVRSRLSRARARMMELAGGEGHELDVPHEREGAARP